MMIQQGTNTLLLHTQLFSVLGEEYLSRQPAYHLAACREELLDMFEGKGKEDIYFPFNLAMNTATTTAKAFSLLLCHIDLDVLEIALGGANSHTVSRFLDHIGGGVIARLWQVREGFHLYDEATILQHQKIILDTLGKIVAGEIL